MANSYTFDRIDAGYRFTLANGTGSAGSQPGSGNGKGGLVLAWVGVLVLFAIQLPIGFLVLATAAAGYYTFKKLKQPKEVISVDRTTPARPSNGVSFEVTNQVLITSKGKSIPAKRINDIEVKNAFDVGFRVQGIGHRSTHVSTGFASATSNAAGSVASAIGQGIANKRAQTAFYVSVQHGGEEDKIVENLTQNAARGIQADILRVIRGETLD